ncbi:hypothetical protein ACFU99_01910 [Streptomyces sp. NPDC057654]|uniref:hypothetical protein n=1 Tax=Streptomyces sp. NPDC057654 TaxID=3346196 RepID=UPI0036C3542A
MHSTTSRIRVTVTDPDTSLPLARVTVAAAAPAVAKTCRRYFGDRWHVDPAPHTTAEDQVPVISVAVDPGNVHSIEQAMVDHEHEELFYAGARALRMHDTDGRAYAVQTTRGVVYRAEADGRRLFVSAMHHDALDVATVRLVRDAIRAQLQADGWVLLRGAAVVRDGKALLIGGMPGAGTTTAVLHLGCAGWELISDGRIFARPAPGGGIHLLPWPAAIGADLPLLDSLGLYDRVREHFLGAPQAHPQQSYEISRALRKGSRASWLDYQGLAQRALSRPADLGLLPAAGGTAAAVLLPRVLPDVAAPSADTHAAEFGDDLFTGAERYPDLLGLAAAAPEQQTDAAQAAQAVRDALVSLPRWSVRLGHDPRATAAFLTNAADTLVFGHSVAAGPAAGPAR